MSKGMLRLVGVAIPVLALALGNAWAQEPPKKEPPAKPEVKKEEAAKDEKDILGAAQDAKLALFVQLVGDAGLNDELKGPGPFTVFAPTDEALKAAHLDEMKKDKAKLADFLKAHIVKGKMMAADVQKVKELKPVAGAPITVEVKDGKVMLDGKIAITKADIAAKNGVLHVVDHAIMAAHGGGAKPEMKPAVPVAKPADKPAEKPANKPGEKKPEEKKP